MWDVNKVLSSIKLMFEAHGVWRTTAALNLIFGLPVLFWRMPELLTAIAAIIRS